MDNQSQTQIHRQHWRQITERKHTKRKTLHRKLK
jgi:hypothetical protein